MKENDVEITDMVEGIDFTEKEGIKQMILDESKTLKEKEKLQAAQTQSTQPNKSLVTFLFMQKPLVNNHRRESKELKKEEILKKRI